MEAAIGTSANNYWRFFSKYHRRKQFSFNNFIENIILVWTENHYLMKNQRGDQNSLTHWLQAIDQACAY